MTLITVPSSVSRRTARATAATLTVAIGLALPGSALAHRKPTTIAPPGNSAVNQYVEDIPTAKGQRPTNTIHPGGGPGPGGGASVPLSQGSASALAHHGQAGRGAAAVAESTSPLGRGTHGAQGGGSSPFATIVKAATGSSPGSGMGALLPILLVVVAIGGGLIALRRRRTD